MTLTMGGIAALSLAVALAFMKKGLAKRAVVYLMLVVGVVGLGGVLGSIVTRIVNSGVRGASNVSDRLLGVSIGGLIVAAVLTIFIYPHVKPRNHQPPTKATPWLALIWGTVAVSVGGMFAAAAGLSANLFATGTNTVSGVLMAFFQGS